jgi:antitoxin VapB
MPLNIRDPRAAELAKELAAKRGTTMTGAIVAALENELRREREKEPLRERLSRLADKAKALAGPHARDVSKEEIDAMWGQ